MLIIDAESNCMLNFALTLSPLSPHTEITLILYFRLIYRPYGDKLYMEKPICRS